MSASEDRLADDLEAVLHLLDRQVIDHDGLAVCKVDDLELTETADGGLAVTGMLAGGAALTPRLGGRLARRVQDFRWRLGLQQAGRNIPWWLGLDRIEKLGSAVDLSVSREGLLVRQPDAPEGTRHHRLNDMLQMAVRDTGGADLGRILDVSLAGRRSGGSGDRLPITGVIVGHARPGSMLGYDRKEEQGPWIVNKVVRRLLRHSRRVAWDSVETIDWESRVLTVAEGAPEPLG